jgi:hypothetical protein
VWFKGGALRDAIIKKERDMSTTEKATAGAPSTTAGAAATPKADGEHATTGNKASKDIVPATYRDRYAANKGTCGDFIAAELSAIMESNGVESLKQIKRENDIPEGAWGGLNNGQQRMNVSNALRTAYLRGHPIKIMGKEFSLETHREDYNDPKFDASNESQIKKFLGFIDMPDNTRNVRAIKKVFHDDPEKAVRKAKALEEADAKREAKAKEKAEAAAKKEADNVAKAAADADKAKKESAKPAVKADKPAAK